MLRLEVLSLLVGLLSVTAQNTVKTFPPDYPHYYNYSHTTKSFQEGYLNLNPDSKSLKPGFYNDTSLQPGRYISFSDSYGKQDLVVKDILHDYKHGYYVDLAAHRFDSGSNTYGLEMFLGWNGVCIEPVDDYYKGIVENRRCKVYINPVTNEPGQVVRFHYEAGQSGVVNKEFGYERQNNNDWTVETATLNDILAHAGAPSIMQYLSLDIEGAEFAAMQNFHFHKYKFMVITVERPNFRLHIHLVKHGYIFVTSIARWGEGLYVHHTLPNLQAVMKGYYNPNLKVSWLDQDRGYLMFPPWTGTYEDYINY